MIYSKYPLKVGQEVEPFPPIQNTANPYLTEAAMHADQANQLEGYGYLVADVGAFTYLGTLAGTAADYEAFGGGTGLAPPNTWFVILLESNTDQENADAINEAIQLAIPTAGKVVINEHPISSGHWLCRTIFWDTRVELAGSGSVLGTTLRSTFAEPLIKETRNNFLYGAYETKGSINRITLDGNNIGTIGADITANIHFKFSQFRIEHFTQIGLKTFSNILGTFEKFTVFYCPIGWHCREGNIARGIFMASNFIIFRDSYFLFCSTYAIDKDKGANLHLVNCNFENNGTSGDTNTGVIKWTNMAPASETPTLIVTGSWFEINYGTLFNLSSSSTCKAIFENTICKFDNSLTKYFNVTGTNFSVNIKNCGFDIDKSFGTFTDSKLIVEDSPIGVLTLIGTATYRKNNIENLTGTILNLANPNGDNYNYTTPLSATTYTTINKSEGAFVSCKINSTQEPVVSGATKISGSVFEANIDMELIVEVKNSAVRYFLLKI